MLMRFDPFRELDRLTEAFGSAVPRTAVPMDAYRRGDQFVVQFDLPGVDPSSIDLTVEKNVLTVSASRRWEPAEGEQVVVNERPQGRFTRQLFLGESLDANAIGASYDNGVLTLTIPVVEQERPGKVEITAHGIPATQAAGGGARAIEAGSTAT